MTDSVFAFRDLLDAADLVTALAASEDESPEVDEALVAAVVRLRDVANAARPYVKPPGPPSPPRGASEWMRA